jgi:hypothetical protein
MSKIAILSGFSRGIFSPIDHQFINVITDRIVLNNYIKRCSKFFES